MHDTFYYVNSFGERLDFGKKRIMADYNDLRDYEWEPVINNDKITGYKKGSVEKRIPTIFIGGDEAFCRRQRNKAFVIFEKDVLANKKGRIYIGDYYLNCNIIGASNDNYKEDGRYLETEFKVRTDKTEWRRDKIQSFFKTLGNASSTGYDYPYGYPYDYGANLNKGQALDNDSDFPIDFTMVIYGPCVNPTIYIGNHRYQVNETLLEGETITISNKDKTIIKTNISREQINIINKRYKPESVFEQIPAGETNINWDGTFGFDIEIHEKRSEPVWEYTVPVEKEETTTGKELLDSSGGFILDNKGERIEVAG